MKLLQKLLLLVALLISTPAQVTNIGTVTFYNAIGWDDVNNVPLRGYRVYIGATNFQAGFTNISLPLTGFVAMNNPTNALVTVTTNRWPGSASTGFNGWRAGYITAVSETGLESDRSKIFLALFRAGVPIPVENIQLYSLVTLAATNALPNP